MVISSSIELSKCVSPDEAYYPNIPMLSIELSSRCNFKCPYCANATLERDYENMEAEIIERIAEQCESLGLRVGGFHGVGEPLVRKDLEVILSNFKRRGIWTGTLYSNCSLLTLDRMKSLYEAGVNFIYNSLDTLDADLYKRTRGGNVHRTIDNVKNAASHFPNVQFVVGLMNHKDQIITPEIREEFQTIFADFPNVGLSVYENSRFPGAAEDWTRFEGLIETCSAPGSILSIDAQGKVALCCTDQNTEHVLGDVRQQTIDEIWYDKKNQETFRNISLGVHGCPDVCFKCILKPTSKGIESIEPILYAPMSKLLAQAEEYFLDTNYEHSKLLYSQALKRDPYNKEVKEKLTKLVQLTGTPDNNPFQAYVDEIHASKSSA